MPLGPIGALSREMPAHDLMGYIVSEETIILLCYLPVHLLYMIVNITVQHDQYVRQEPGGDLAQGYERGK